MTAEEKKEALVTGVTGFIGSHLVKRLVDDGWKVHAIVRPESNLEPIYRAGGGIIVHRHYGTMEELTDLFRNIKPSVVFHLASRFLSEHKASDIEELVASNIRFGLQLIEAMTTAGVRRLVNTGTSWQHFNSDHYNPVNLYAASKEAFEVLLRYYVETRGLKTITLKLFDTYGPDDPRPKLFALLRRAEASRQELAMSPGGQMMDIVYIDDVIDAFMTAADRLFRDEGSGIEEYALSSGSRITLREVVETYQRVTGKKLTIRWGGRPYRDREVMVPWSGGHRLEGWNPKVSLEEGIALLNLHTEERVA